MERINETNIYLTSHDNVYGIIHDDQRIYAFVEIEQITPTSYAFKNLENYLYFCSKPLGNDEKIRTFISNRKKALAYEEFNLKKVNIENNDMYVIFLNFLRDFKNEDVINLYWWRHNDFLNFGDELNPHIIAYLTNKKVKRVVEVKTDIVAIGSILNRFPKRQRPYEVWGTGTLSPSELRNKDCCKVSLLRGPLTKSLMSQKSQIPFGDPGILSSIVWNKSSQKLYDWGILVHYTQAHKPWVKKLIKNTPNSILIDVKHENLTELMLQISSCKNIASTSLHGLVVADSYQIPNIWLWDDNIHMGGQWKFFDYFSGIGRHYIDNVNPLKIRSLSEVKLSKSVFSYFNQIENVQKRVIKAFPLL